MRARRNSKDEANPSSDMEREVTKPGKGMSRRDFLRYAAGTAATISLGSFSFLSGCDVGGSDDGPALQWPIATQVLTTVDQQIFPIAVPLSAPHINPTEVSAYAPYGYSDWQLGPGLPYQKRTDLAPAYAGAPNVARLLSFFAISDIHITDKESPAQPIYMGVRAGYGSGMSSAYSPVILSTTHVLDAAVQTINALHRRSPFDFGISLGDNINNAQYNELRWFIDVMDGYCITPSSGGNLGAGFIDYQMPYETAGLNPAIPWYQAIGNHDQYWSGVSYENEKTMNAHVSNTILNMGYSTNPAEAGDIINRTGYYMGVIDGLTPYGNVIGAGPQEGFSTPPTVVADAGRRSLATSASSSLNWMREFFTTISSPVGHGFTQTNLDNDFACYSFVPKSNIPIKVIVLDDTVKGPGQPNYAAGGLDTIRLNWLKSELQAGQDNNQLMIIAAHVPIKPQRDLDNTAPFRLFITPGFTDDALLSILHNYPNLILWIAGHRHVNVVTPQPSPDVITHPEQSFWEVETASLRDFPQGFRTFDIRRNSDNTISILVTNVDPAVTGLSPAAKSRGYAIGAIKIYGHYPLTDTSSHVYNAELVKQLTPAMQAVIANCGSAV